MTLELFGSQDLLLKREFKLCMQRLAIYDIELQNIRDLSIEFCSQNLAKISCLAAIGAELVSGVGGGMNNGLPLLTAVSAQYFIFEFLFY